MKQKLLIFTILFIIILIIIGKFRHSNSSKNISESQNSISSKNISESQNSNIKKITTKEFVDLVISNDTYTISSFTDEFIYNYSEESLDFVQKTLEFDNLYYLVLKYFDYFLEKCQLNKAELNLNKNSFKSSFDDGFVNAKYLIDIYKNEFPTEYSEMRKSVNDVNNLILGRTKENVTDCDYILKLIREEDNGIFRSEELEQELLYFNYILSPESELKDGYINTFSTSMDENSLIMFDLPKSWNNINDVELPDNMKKITPHEDFLNATIVFSFFSESFGTKDILNHFHDNTEIESIYDDDKLFSALLTSLGFDYINNTVYSSTYNNGLKKYILINSKFDLGRALNNDLAKNKFVEQFTIVGIHHGMLFYLNFGSPSDEAGLNSFDYYSNLFFQVFLSIKFKELKKDTIYLSEENNMKFIFITINGVEYKLLLDTGATTIVLNKKILNNLLNSGVINHNNFVGKSKTEIADGSIIDTEIWLLPEIKVGGKIINDINVTVINSEEAIPLFGMDGLKRLDVLKLNLDENEIILNSN